MSISQAQAALLEVVEQDRQVRCSALLSAAESSSEALLASAHEASRARLRSAVQAERQRTAALIAAARARLQAAERQAQHRRAAHAMASAAQQLPAALRALWQDDEQRQNWLSATLQTAATRLPLAGWIIHHPPALSSGDLLWLQQAAEKLGVSTTRHEAKPGIVAGIVIEVGNARFDATIDGLLADRGYVDGRLRHYLEAP